MKKTVILFIIMIPCVFLFSCGELDWPDTRLGNMIPKIEGAKGEIYYESLESLSIHLSDVTENQFYNYMEECKNKGFTIDALEDYDSYCAYNSDGYKIDIYYYYDKDMSIDIDAPMLMSSFTWPNSSIVKLIPKPQSNYGKIEFQSENNFCVYVGNTSKTDYLNYVNEVSALGFTVDYRSGDDYYYADNADGYSISLRYEGFNIMYIYLDEPDDDEDDEDIDFDYEFEDESKDTNSDQHNTNNTQDNNSNNTVTGIRPEFKKAMDSYEAFFDEYCEFMKNYTTSSSLESLNEYLDFLEQYAETMEALEEIENDNLSTAELAYYTATMNRILEKLSETY